MHSLQSKRPQQNTHRAMPSHRHPYHVVYSPCWLQEGSEGAVWTDQEMHAQSVRQCLRYRGPMLYHGHPLTTSVGSLLLKLPSENEMGGLPAQERRSGTDVVKDTEVLGPRNCISLWRDQLVLEPGLLSAGGCEEAGAEVLVLAAEIGNIAAGSDWPRPPCRACTV